jgi:regulatory protein
MPIITKISEQKKRENRRNIHLDGRFAFGVNLNVVAKFKLKEGLNLTDAQVLEIQEGELRQECFDHAMRFLEMRLHSRAELHKKLTRREYGEAVIVAVLENLQRMGYLDDKRFATAKALSAAQRKHHGRRRAAVELMKSGVQREVAQRALEDVYESHDSMAVARELARKKAPGLKRFDDATARRRLYGMLLRRGFLYDEIRPVVDEVLGANPQGDNTGSNE